MNRWEELERERLGAIWAVAEKLARAAEQRDVPMVEMYHILLNTEIGLLKKIKEGYNGKPV